MNSSPSSSSFDNSGSSHERLIGVEGVITPDWASTATRLIQVSFWKSLQTLPRSFSVILRMAWRTSPRLLIVMLGLDLLSGCVGAFGLLATANVFTSLLETGPTPHRVLASAPAMAIVVCSYSIRALLDSGSSAIEGVLRPRIKRNADVRVTEALVRVRLLAMEDADFRELARQGAHDGVTAIENSVHTVASLMGSSVALASALGTVGYLSPWLPPALIVAAVINGWAATKVVQLNHQHFMDTVTENMRKAVIDEVATDRTFALERHALTLQEQLIYEYRQAADFLMSREITLTVRRTFTQLKGRAATGIGSGLIYVLLAVLLYFHGIELALAGAAVVAMRTASAALSNSLSQLNILHDGSLRIDLYQRLLSESERFKAVVTGRQAPQAPRQIQLSGVSFFYPGREEPALSGIDLVVHAGETIALVGENGSGKTTLGKIMTGLYPPTEGAVYWDGADLSEVDELSVHSQVAIIAQDPARWPMTAWNNVHIGRLNRSDADNQLWQESISKSGADAVISHLPEGGRTVLSKKFKNGYDLSGGEWQRFGVARGIFRDAYVIVADEPTAALDAKAETKVFESLRSLVEHTNGIATLVTHRLSNVRTVDRIVVLDKGKIVESGTHEELIAVHGHYYELYELQARAYRD